MRNRLWSAVALLVMVFFAFGTSRSDKSTQKEADKPAARESPAGGSPQKGETGYIEVEGESTVRVPVDEMAQSELNSFSRAKNEDAIRQMMQQGRVLVCTKGTKVTVVEPGVMSTTVRIMEGKHEGETGIVSNECLHK